MIICNCILVLSNHKECQTRKQLILKQLDLTGEPYNFIMNQCFSLLQILSSTSDSLIKKNIKKNIEFKENCLFLLETSTVTLRKWAIYSRN